MRELIRPSACLKAASVRTARGKSVRCTVGPRSGPSLIPSVRLFPYLERSLHVATKGVNRRYVVQDTTVIHCPAVNCLGSPISFIMWPSQNDGIMTGFRRMWLLVSTHMSNKFNLKESSLSTVDIQWSWKYLPTHTTQNCLNFELYLLVLR